MCNNATYNKIERDGLIVRMKARKCSVTNRMADTWAIRGEK